MRSHNSAERASPAGGGCGLNYATTYTYDALGRARQVTTADNSTVQTAYSGNAMTVTDEAGKKRSTFTDVLGRITQVSKIRAVSAT